MTEARDRILIVAPAWVGDMVMAHALVQVVHATLPGTRVDMVASAALRSLAERMEGLHTVHELPVGHGQLGLMARWRLARRLGGTGYQRAIVLPNSLKSALLPWLSRIPRRTGYLGEWRWGLLNDVRRLVDKRRPAKAVQLASLALPPGTPWLESVPEPRLRVDSAHAARARRRLGLDAGQPVLAMCPGAEYGPAKRWPAEYFARLAVDRLDRGWAVWLLGAAGDAPVTATIQSATGGRCADLAGATSLLEAVDLLAEAHAVVTNDSGLMHVAAAVGSPVVALFGSSDPGYTPPLSERARVEYLALSCSPCFARHCPLGHLNCLRQLDWEHVSRTLDTVAAVPEVS